MRTDLPFKNAQPWLAACKLLAVALVYAGLSKASLNYFSAAGAASIFWPPAGFALAAVLLGGRRYAFSVFLGATLAGGSDPNFTLYWAVGLAAANALESLVGQWLILRGGAFSNRIDHLRDFFRIAVLGGFLSAGVGALAGATVLLLAGSVSSAHFTLSVLHWWMGDALGIIMLTPLLLVWRPQAQTQLRLQSGQGLESVLLFVLAFLIGQTIFFGWFGVTSGAAVGHYVMFLLVAWIAVRLGLRGVVLVLFLAASQGVLGLYQGGGMFAGNSVQSQQINFWFFLLLLSTVGMSLAAHVNEHARLTAELRLAKNRQDALLEAIPDLLFEIDLQGRYHNIYTHQQELLVAPRQQLQGSRVQDQLPSAAAAVVEAALQQANRQGSCAGHQYQLALPQGPAWFELSVSRMPAHGVTASPHFIVLSRDITDRKLQEQHQRQREAQLRETLVREVHHRIKNNLQGVTGVLRQFSERHPQTAIPINEAISQVQSIAAIHGLQGRTLLGEVMLAELVQSVAAGVQSLWHIPIRLTLTPDASTSQLAQADAVPLALVLNELLSNAVKHGGRRGEVSVCLQKFVAASDLVPQVCLTVTNFLDAAPGGVRATQLHCAGLRPSSSGLELVAALLPPVGARLEHAVEGGKFISTLELQAPAMTWKVS